MATKDEVDYNEYDFGSGDKIKLDDGTRIRLSRHQAQALNLVKQAIRGVGTIPDMELGSIYIRKGRHRRVIPVIEVLRAAGVDESLGIPSRFQTGI